MARNGSRIVPVCACDTVCVCICVLECVHMCEYVHAHIHTQIEIHADRRHDMSMHRSMLLAVQSN